MALLLPISGPATESLRFVAFATDAHSRVILANVAASRGWLAAEIREGDLEAAHSYIAATAPPAVLLIDIGDCVAPLEAVDSLADVCAADTRVLAIGTCNDVALFRGLRALGVCDYLLKPLNEADLQAAFDAAMAEALPAPPASQGQAARKPEMFAFVGARGGCGATTVAISTAAVLAEVAGQRVVLVDFDLQAGSAALDLEAESSPGFAALLESPDRVDQLLVDAALVPHALGFSMLTAEEPIDRPLRVQPEAVQALLAAVATGADIIVVDLPRRLDRAARAILRTADRVAIVTPMSLAGMRETRRLASFVTGLRAGQRPLVIANRSGETGAEVARSDFEKGIGGRLDIMLPHAPRLAAKATEKATALVHVSGNAALAVGLRRVATELCSAGVAKHDGSIGLFHRLKQQFLDRKR